MVYLEKSQPAPNCLAVEKAKTNGNYKCGDVLTRLRADFKNKCYLCESKEPVNINVEHFIAHKGDAEKKFDWNNLFYSCGHCNNTKLADYEGILNCTIETDEVETSLRYEMKPFPKEMVSITAVDNDSRTHKTRDLLLQIFNGDTVLKKIEADNLRNHLLREIKQFQDMLIGYFEYGHDEQEKQRCQTQIKLHLDKSSSFTAFKRWIIRDNPSLMTEFGHLLV